MFRVSVACEYQPMLMRREIVVRESRGGRNSYAAPFYSESEMVLRLLDLPGLNAYSIYLQFLTQAAHREVQALAIGTYPINSGSRLNLDGLITGYTTGEVTVRLKRCRTCD